MTTSYRVIRDTSTRRDHGTSTNDRVFLAGASCVLRGVSTCCIRCTSASGRVRRASACCVIRGARSSWVRCASANGPVYRASTGRVIRGTSSGRKRCTSACCVVRGVNTCRAHGVPGIGGVDFGSSPILATDHTIYELCLPSECDARILRVEKIHSCVTGFELSAARALSSALSIGVSMAVIVSKSAVGLELVSLSSGTSSSLLVSLQLHVFEDFKLIEGLMLRIESRNYMFEVLMLIA